MASPHAYSRENLELSPETRRIISLVLGAVHYVDWVHTPRGEMPADWTPEPVLRTVITYCYATGSFSSEEIEAATLHDPVVRYLCANHTPTWERIREFRRLNTTPLKGSIALVLEGMANTYTGCSVARFHPPVNYSLEAEHRLLRAIQADSNSLDV